CARAPNYDYDRYFDVW
nr:immunoglobulin heavy chain junction region [Mus musculus]